MKEITCKLFMHSQHRTPTPRIVGHKIAPFKGFGELAWANMGQTWLEIAFNHLFGEVLALRAHCVHTAHAEAGILTEVIRVVVTILFPWNPKLRTMCALRARHSL